MLHCIASLEKQDTPLLIGFLLNLLVFQAAPTLWFKLSILQYSNVSPHVVTFHGQIIGTSLFFFFSSDPLDWNGAGGDDYCHSPMSLHNKRACSKVLSEWTDLPRTLIINETERAPQRPPMANMDTVMDQRSVDVSAPMGSPYRSTHVLL